MIHLHRRPTALCLLLWILCVCLGCGKADYDQLVQKRISDLRSGRAAVPRWQAYASDRFSFVCEVPAAPTLTPTDTDQIESEKLDAVVGSTAYQIVFLRGDTKQLGEASARVRQQYESAGFQIEGDQEDANIGGYPGIRFHFVNNDSGTTARVQVFVLSDNRSCAMSVVGSQLNDGDVLRFFDSFADG